MTIIVRGFLASPQLLVTRGYASGAPPATIPTPDPGYSTGQRVGPDPGYSTGSRLGPDPRQSYGVRA
jgi:hypothetical protein